MNPKLQLLFDDLTKLTEKYHRQLPSIDGVVHVDHIEQLITHFQKSQNINELDNFYFPETLSEFNFDTYYEDEIENDERRNCKIENQFLVPIDQAYTKAKSILESHISNYMDSDIIPQQCIHIIVPKNRRQPSRSCSHTTIFSDTGKCVKHDGEYIKSSPVLILEAVII